MALKALMMRSMWTAILERAIPSMSPLILIDFGVYSGLTAKVWVFFVREMLLWSILHFVSLARKAYYYAIRAWLFRRCISLFISLMAGFPVFC